MNEKKYTNDLYPSLMGKISPIQKKQPVLQVNKTL
ncbi:hypothetical protein C8P65_1062 [Capnocytophaga leadbetteri]|uniref:Uncharacterized protein n=1 Tax=Capnocytophaga leadbetteri TaxID=327575 RepID=A0A2T5XUA1_9FLAO|nr:hypothetical protein C8P65_1062 [Capnocytophaga leadbetteri]